MRVLFVLGYPNPFPGAAWSRVAAFARNLAAAGDRVDVLGLVSPANLFRAGVRGTDGVRLLNLCPGFADPRGIPAALGVALSLAAVPLVRLLQPDVVVLSVPTGPTAVGAFLGARLAGAGIVVDYRDEWEDFLLARAGPRTRRMLAALKSFMTRVYRGSDVVLATTPPLAEALASRGVRDPVALPNGADLAVFRPLGQAARPDLGLGKETFVAIHAGMIGAYYRLDVVAEAFARLGVDVRPRARLLLAGTVYGSHLRDVRAAAEHLGIADRVRYVGAVAEPERLARLLSAADVGLVPYDDDPLWRHALPTKVMEYCACGLPIVATVPDDSLLARTLQEHDVGLAVPPLDADALARALERLARDPDARRRMGANARRLAEKHFDREALARTFADRIHDVAQRRRER